VVDQGDVRIETSDSGLIAARPHARTAFTPPMLKYCPRIPDDQFCNRLYDVEIRRVICSTNSTESLNARYRRATKARGHFPSEQAAMKCLYQVRGGVTS
jgi:hypothetical protein